MLAVERSPLTTDEVRWNPLVFEAPGRVFIQRTDGAVYWAGLKIQAARHEMHLDRTQTAPDPFFRTMPAYVAMFGPQWTADFVFEASPEVVVMRGTYSGRPVVVKLRRDATRFLLTEPVQWLRR
jgi:hypothetical protein